jgi:hypothetical protein
MHSDPPPPAQQIGRPPRRPADSSPDADETRREERAKQLQELTAALSAALDPEAVGTAIMERAMPALSANAGNVFLLDANNR